MERRQAQLCSGRSRPSPARAGETKRIASRRSTDAAVPTAKEVAAGSARISRHGEPRADIRCGVLRLRIRAELERDAGRGALRGRRTERAQPVQRPGGLTPPFSLSLSGRASCPAGPAASGALSRAVCPLRLSPQAASPRSGRDGTTSASRVSVCVTNPRAPRLLPLQDRLRKRPS